MRLARCTFSGASARAAETGRQLQLMEQEECIAVDENDNDLGAASKRACKGGGALLARRRPHAPRRITEPL